MNKPESQNKSEARKIIAEGVPWAHEHIPKALRKGLSHREIALARFRLWSARNGIEYTEETVNDGQEETTGGSESKNETKVEEGSARG